MKRTLVTAFAALLLASASTAALAQDQDRGHGRGDRQGAEQRGGEPRGWARGEGQGRGGDRDWNRGERPEFRGADRASPRALERRHEFSPRQAPPAQAAPQADRAPTVERRERPAGDRFGPGGAGRRPSADEPRVERRDGQRWDGQRRDGQRWDGQRWDGQRRDADRRDYDRTRRDGDRRDWDRRDDGRRDNDRRYESRRGDHRDGPRWERGRYPSVYRSPQRYRGGYYRPPVGFYIRTWSFGDILPRGWYGDDYLLGDFWSYGLPYPPPGYDWVRVGDDALLIDSFTGRIVQVVRDIFW